MIHSLRLLIFFSMSYILALLMEMTAHVLIRKDVQKLHVKLLALKSSGWGAKSHQLVTRALVLAEDHRYYYHAGADFFAIGRALFMLCHGQRQGASTIEQQLVRTVTEQYKISLNRKLKELMLASTLRNILTKNEIADLYLSVAYFGYNMHGAQLACEKLNINIVDGNFNSYCKLISLLKYPLKKDRNSVHFARWEMRQSHIQRLRKKLARWTSTKNLQK